MQVRTYLAIAAWSILGIGLAQQGRFHYPPTPEERVDALHKGFQAALDDLTMTQLRPVHGKDADGNPTTYMKPPTFGVSRVPTATLIHNGVIRDTRQPFRLQLKEGEVEYFAVSSLGKPLKPHKMTLHKDFGSFAYQVKPNEAKEIVDFADQARIAFGRKRPYSGHLFGFDAEARPLVLSKPECMPCHEQSKLGDTLAILVFVLKKS